MYIDRAQQPIRFLANIKINLFNLEGKYLMIDGDFAMVFGKITICHHNFDQSYILKF